MTKKDNRQHKKAIPSHGNSFFIHKGHARLATIIIVVAGIMASSLLFVRDMPDISNTPRLLSMAISVALLYGLVAARGGGSAIRHSLLTCWLPLLLFVVWQMASIGWATNKGEALYDASRWLLAAAVVVLAENLASRKPAHAVVLLAPLSAVVFIISASVALVQVAELGDLSWNSRYSVASIHTHKGTFAMLVMLTTLFPLMHMLLFRRRRWFYLTLLLAQLATILFLQARAVLLAAVVMALVALFLWLSSFVRCTAKPTPADLQYRHVRLSTLLLTLLLGVAIVAGCRWFAFRELSGPDQSGGLRSNASIYERQSLWRMTFRMVDDRPLTGCGTGNWKVCYPNAGVEDVFSIDVLDFVFVRPHNDYLKVLSETGYVGLFLLLLPVGMLAVGVWRNTGRRGKSRKLFELNTM